MRTLGFSSGALNPKEPRRAIECSLDLGLDAIELSALRMSELDAVAEALRDPRIGEFSWVSLHAPSDVPSSAEREVADRLIEMSAGRFAVVVHPEVIRTPEAWAALGPLLLLENMDRRKAIGRFADEFTQLFERHPEAGLCLDVAHVRQVDPSMTEGLKFLRLFGSRLREIHVSEVTSSSAHTRISIHAEGFMKDVLTLIPSDVPVIIESVLGECRPSDEVLAVAALFGESAESPIRQS